MSGTTDFQPIGTTKNAFNATKSRVAKLLQTVEVGSEFTITRKEARGIRQRTRYYANKRGIQMSVSKIETGFVIRAVKEKENGDVKN